MLSTVQQHLLWKRRRCSLKSFVNWPQISRLWRSHLFQRDDLYCLESVASLCCPAWLDHFLSSLFHPSTLLKREPTHFPSSHTLCGSIRENQTKNDVFVPHSLRTDQPLMTRSSDWQKDLHGHVIRRIPSSKWKDRNSFLSICTWIKCHEHDESMQNGRISLFIPFPACWFPYFRVPIFPHTL